MISASKSIPWMPWIPLAITASLLFFLCAGFLLFAKSDIQSVVYEITLISFIVGGILFLLDVILVLRALDESQNASSTIKAASAIRSLTEIEHMHKSVQTQIDIGYNISTNELFMEPEIFQSPTRDYHPIRKIPPTIASSHGGTFHVSKTVVPISTLRTMNSEISKPDICECEVTRLRSVGIGVRPVTKLPEEPSKIPTPKATTPVATQSHCPKSKVKNSLQIEEETESCQARQTHRCERVHHVRRNADEPHQQRPNTTSKTNDYTIYQFAITTDSEKSTGSSSPEDPKSKPYESVFTSPRLLSTLDEEIDIDKQSKTEKKSKKARTILEIPENNTSESEEYRLKIYNLLYPQKRSTSSSTLEHKYSRLTPLPTVLPGELLSQEPSERVTVREQIIQSETTSYSRTKKYHKLSEASKAQRSSSARDRDKEEDTKKKNSPSP
ncbi:hypothetical protein FQR65_LT13810 [Abscondita terminalis]|nr:hypothetical protein FQR65_LT13810 [Abscondita terminalis]